LRNHWLIIEEEPHFFHLFSFRLQSPEKYMFERFKKWQHSLSMQVVVTLTGLVFLTALAVGIPALWIIRNQLERQAWALVEQGSQTSHAILDNRQSDLNNLTILTAQRPTLKRLVEEKDYAELEPYLTTLQEGAGTDLLLLCSESQMTLLQVGQEIGDEACAAGTGFYFEETPAGKHGWLLSEAVLHDSEESPVVVLGKIIDNRFAAQLKNETGMEQILLFDQEFVASSLPDGARVWDLSALANSDSARTLSFSSGGVLHYAIRTPYDRSEVELVVALPVSGLLAARQQLTFTVAAGIFGVILLTSALGITRSRHISRPLEKLRDAAEELRRGELSNPIRINSRINELAMLSYALDDARMALDHSLNELRQEKDWSEHILESVIEGIVTIDKFKRITFFSHGAEEITGWQQEQVIGRSIDEIFPLAEEDAYFSQRLPASEQKQKIVVRLRNGSAATLAVTGAKLAPPEAGKADTALVLRDVSNEEAIRRLLGDFLANISHEFRTPLSALTASVELLLDRLPELKPHELRQLLDNIHLGTIRLQNLIDNLLEGASIETGRFRIWAQPCAAPEIVEEAVNAIRPLTEKYELHICKDWPDDLPLVLADFRRTTQVVVNLLSNAVKWSPPGSEILVLMAPAAGSVEVHISDQGPGIQPENLPDLFHRFGQRAGDGAAHGTGLGLSVVKAIVEAQGGQVGVLNRPGGGAEFWFSMRVTEGDGGTP
jgi:PAS domain S-box-containing protein